MWFLCSQVVVIVVVVLAVVDPSAQSLLAHPHIIDWLYMYPISRIKKYSRNYGLCAIHPILPPTKKKTIQHLWHILINLNLLVMHKSVKRIWIVEIHVIWPMPSKNEIQSNAKTTTTKSACWQRNNQSRSVSRSPKSMLVILWTWYTHIQIQVQVRSLGLGARVFSINKWIYDWMHFKFDRKKG